MEVLKGRKYFEWASKSKEVYQWLESVLDGHLNLIEPTQSSAFAIEHDLNKMCLSEDLKRLPRQEIDKAFFEVLSRYYEFGFELRFERDEWKLIRMAAFGQVFVSERGAGVRAPFEIPEMSETQVLNGRGAGVLKAFKLGNIDAFLNSDSFLFKANSQQCYLVVTNLARPWTVGRVEKTFELLTEIAQTLNSRI